MSSPLVRFAPSPTGLLHAGNARIAIINWLFTRHHGGHFLLRMDDTDTERSTKEFEVQIMADLAWLGLGHDIFFRQSERSPLYEANIARLKAKGRLYACYESPEELSLKRKTMLARNVAPVYDRTGLALTEEEKQILEKDGRKPHWRFLLEDSKVVWADLSRGTVSFEGRHLSDPVLIREDGRPLYTLSSVLDDIEGGVTHIIRGADHISNTAIQIQLFEAFDAQVPSFAHLPLLSGEQGEGLSKRLGSLSLKQFATEGIRPEALLNYLGLLGTNRTAVEPVETLVADFDIKAFGKANPTFSMAVLTEANMRVLQQTSFSDVAPEFERMGLEGLDSLFWETVRGNINKIDDCRLWHDILNKPFQPRPEEADRDYLTRAAETVPTELEGSSYKQWTKSLAQTTGRKGKQLYMPLRQALTGLDYGPELDKLIHFLGHDRTKARLKGLKA